MPDTLSLDVLTAAARSWAAGSPLDEAAVTLLVEHDGWLRRRDFVAAATQYYAGDDEDTDEPMLAIRWKAAAKFAETAHGSTTEIAVLELAAAIGSDRYRLGSMGKANAAAIVRAITAAMDR